MIKKKYYLLKLLFNLLFLVYILKLEFLLKDLKQNTF